MGWRKAFGIASIFFLFLSACSYPTFCSLLGVASVQVEVHDDQGQPAALGATATLTNASGEKASETGYGEASFIAVDFGNQGGPFTLDVTRPYHRSVRVENLSTPVGGCGITHPARASVTLELETNAPPVRQVVVGGPNGYGACIEDQLHAGVVAAPGISKEVTWKSSDPSVASITPSGLLRAGCGEAGQAYLTATSVVDPTKYGVLEVEASGVGPQN